MPESETCWKGLSDCKCKVGWPPDEQCPDCREDQKRGSRCVCPPPDTVSTEDE